jgi:hypothetical protein
VGLVFPALAIPTRFDIACVSAACSHQRRTKNRQRVYLPCGDADADAMNEILAPVAAIVLIGLWRGRINDLLGSRSETCRYRRASDTGTKGRNE